LELPHELYLPFEPVLERLRSVGMVGILSHPERNQGLLRRPQLIGPLVERGCLMQITAGSLAGMFGAASRAMGEWMLTQEFVHFVSTDAHGANSRRPLMRKAFHRVAELTDGDTAVDLCSRHPWLVANGKHVPDVRRKPKKGRLAAWFGLRKAG
jgi:protein-tyrosine phosphatase